MDVAWKTHDRCRFSRRRRADGAEERFSTGCPRPRSPRTAKRRWAGGGKRGARIGAQPQCRPRRRARFSCPERNIARLNPGRVAFPTPSPTAPRFLRGTGAVDVAWKTHDRCRFSRRRRADGVEERFPRAVHGRDPLGQQSGGGQAVGNAAPGPAHNRSAALGAGRCAILLPGTEHRPFQSGPSCVSHTFARRAPVSPWDRRRGRSVKNARPLSLLSTTTRRWCRGAFSTGCPRPRSPRTIQAAVGRRWETRGTDWGEPLCRPHAQGRVPFSSPISNSGVATVVALPRGPPSVAATDASRRGCPRPRRHFSICISTIEYRQARSSTTSPQPQPVGRAPASRRGFETRRPR